MPSPEESASSESSPGGSGASESASPQAVEPSPVLAVAVDAAGDSWRRLFPVVRCVPRTGFLGGDRSQVVALFEQGVVAGRAWGDGWKAEECLQAGGAGALLKQLSWVTNASWDEVREAVLIRPRLLDPRAQLRLRTTAGRTIKIKMPPEDTPHVIEVLQHKLGDRFQIAARIPLHLDLKILCVQLLCLLGFIPLAFGEWNPVLYVPIVVFILATLAQLGDHYPRRLPHEIPPKPAKPSKDRSGREPFRSRLVGGVLRFGFGLILLLLLAAGIVVPPLLLLPFVLLSLVGLYAGHMLAQAPPKYVEQQDQRPPILYLRSFLDDAHGDLDPQTWTARALGVTPPQGLPSPWRYIFLANPLRILRLMFGLAADTAEEQLGLALRERGPFVAIGKPGEWFATPGANRMYVTNETWQGVVLDYLAKSQVVLLQPAKTPGVLWELKRSFEHTDPRKMLLCLVNFKDKANDYETFRKNAEEFLPHPLPRSVPFQPAPCFLYFDAQWKPVLQPVSYYSELSWPFRGSAANLEYSLSNFFKGLKQPSALPAASRITYPGHGSLAFILYFLLWPIALSFLPLGGMLPRLARDLQAAREANQQLQDGGRGSEKSDASRNQDPSKHSLIKPLTERARAAADLALAEDEIIKFSAEGKLTEALAEAERMVELYPGEEMAYLLRGSVRDSLGELELAIADYAKAIELDPKFAVAYNNRAITLLKQKKPSEALADFNRSIQLNPNFAKAYENRGYLHLENDRMELALADYNRALELKPGSFDAHYYRAIIHAAGNRLEEALADYDQVLQLNPKHAEAHNLRGVTWLRAGQPAKAVEDFSQAIELNPNYAKAYENRGFIHLQNDQLELALTDYNRALELEPRSFDALYNRAVIHAAGNRLQAALNDFNLALQINPQHADAYNRRGVVWTRGGRPNEALADFNKAIEFSPKPNLQYLENRANNLLQRNQLPAAQVDLENLLAADPKRTELLPTLGVLQAATGNYKAALQSLSEHARLNPQSAAARRFVFITQHAEGKIDDALATLKQAHADLAEKAAPADANALAWIAVLIHDRIDDWKLPLELSQRALDAEPKNLEFQITRAAVQIRAGEPQPAAEALRAAIALQKGEGAPMQFALLAVAEAKLNKLAEARQAFDIARAKVNAIWPPDKRAIPVMNWAPRIALEQLLAEVEPLLPPAPKRPEPPRPPAEEPEVKNLQPAQPPQEGLLPAKM